MAESYSPAAPMSRVLLPNALRLHSVPMKIGLLKRCQNNGGRKVQSG